MARANVFTVFVVDDDTKLLTMMKHYLEKNSEYNLDVHTYATGEDALARIDLKPEIMILDYYFDDLKPGAKNGIEVMKETKKKSPSTEVIMISGQDDMEVALETIRQGAYDYVIKNDKAIMRAQLVAEKLLEGRMRQVMLEQNNKNLRITVGIMIAFIIILTAFVLYATIF